MKAQGADLLAQLRDIHAAPAVPWWPPAPGWWVLAMLVAVTLFFAIRYALRAFLRVMRRRHLYRFVASVEAGIDPVTAPQDFLSAINRVFKIVAIGAFPEQSCAHMQGAEWAGFLQRNFVQNPDTEALAVLAEGPYQPASEFDHAALTRLAMQWIRQYG